ncbi:uncharacterized protein DKFZp434B061-like isoform X2 [Mustela putorius furo]|uniref:Uncharacterized protein DKFZp434B061-like isoform X2 n=1 Tax=Mustela putorius furo TaxID=9669 RepID=M3Y5D6_MUSPF|nr:uncharacterized protein DKFZp434B061-like isoform X2 [Mustela putorius furo]
MKALQPTQRRPAAADQEALHTTRRIRGRPVRSCPKAARPAGAAGPRSPPSPSEARAGFVTPRRPQRAPTPNPNLDPAHTPEPRPLPQQFPARDDQTTSGLNAHAHEHVRTSSEHVRTSSELEPSDAHCADARRQASRSAPPLGPAQTFAALTPPWSPLATPPRPCTAQTHAPSAYSGRPPQYCADARRPGLTSCGAPIGAARLLTSHPAGPTQSRRGGAPAFASRSCSLPGMEPNPCSLNSRP